MRRTDVRLALLRGGLRCRAIFPALLHREALSFTPILALARIARGFTGAMALTRRRAIAFDHCRVIGQRRRAHCH